MPSLTHVVAHARDTLGLDDQRLFDAARRLENNSGLLRLFDALDLNAPGFAREMRAFRRSAGGDAQALSILALLKHLGDAEAFYRRHGIPDSVYQATLDDIRLNMTEYEAIHHSLGLSEAQFFWLNSHLKGEIFRLGLLQFKRKRLEEDTAFGDETLLKGSPVLDTHIPSDRRLIPADVQASYAMAPRFFQEYFGFAAVGFVCESWLLAEELKGLRPPASNSLAFQSQYRLAPGGETDDSVIQYVFKAKEGTPYQQLPDHNAFQKRLKSFYLSGGQIHARYGFRPRET